MEHIYREYSNLFEINNFQILLNKILPIEVVRTEVL